MALRQWRPSIQPPRPPTTNPAVTVRSVGASGGQAAAFTYDLARSVVYTRQGNPAWAGQNRDPNDPSVSRIITHDMYLEMLRGTPNRIISTSTKLTIPQADEQQRLLANLIQFMNRDKKPLPHFWYFPRGEKAVVIMTGDDHGGGTGTIGRFDHYKAISTPVARWITGNASAAAPICFTAGQCQMRRQPDTTRMVLRSVCMSIRAAWIGRQPRWRISTRISSIPGTPTIQACRTK